MDTIYIIVIILIILLFVMYIAFIKLNKTKEEQDPIDDQLPYQICKKLLTDKELKFYNSLKPITDELGYNIMCKVRLKDLLDIPEGSPNYMKWFNAVKSKHIDFVICSEDTSPLFAVEVDDKTHDKADRQKRDAFINRIFEDKQVKLLRYRTWTSEQLKGDINAIKQHND